MSGDRHAAQAAISLLLAGALALLPAGAADASGERQSGSGSSNSSDSSKGSGDSSNTSRDSFKSTSDSSHSDSSKNSDKTTQNSPKNSSEWTTKGSTDWTTHSHDAHVISIALLVVGLGAAVLGVALTAHSHRDPGQATALAGFMRRQHALLLHDVSTGEGPVLDAWAHDLRLTAAERGRLRRSLEGSAEQGELLEALDGPIGEAHAELFGAAFFRVTDRALGPTRTKALVTRAISASHGS